MHGTAQHAVPFHTEQIRNPDAYWLNRGHKKHCFAPCLLDGDPWISLTSAPGAFLMHMANRSKEPSLLSSFTPL